MKKYLHYILTKETHSDKEASFLELLIIICDNKFHTKSYDKRDSFGFTIINYPHPVTSNIPDKPVLPRSVIFTEIGKRDTFHYVMFYTHNKG